MDVYLLLPAGAVRGMVVSTSVSNLPINSTAGVADDILCGAVEPTKTNTGVHAGARGFHQERGGRRQQAQALSCGRACRRIRPQRSIAGET